MKDAIKDKDLFEFYAAITSMFFELQKQTDGRTLGYVVPGSVSGFVQSLHSEGLINLGMIEIQIG